MTFAGTIFALDLGQRCGYAVGASGKLYRSGTVLLKKADEHRSVAFSNLIVFLSEHFSEEKPVLVVKEAPLPLQAFRNLGNGEAVVRMALGLHAATEAMCVRYGVPCEEFADSKIRKHFIGQARMGTRPETKAATVKRAQLLGYMPKEIYDEDRADALATWDFAAATYARSAPRSLHLFGESAV